MPPERSVDQETMSGLLPATFSITARSCGVSSLSQPSFLSTPERELGIAVLELGADRIGAVSKQAFAVALDAETSPEGTAAVLHRQVGVVQDGAAGVFQLARAPARPRQAVNIAAHLRIVLWRAQRHHVEFGLVAHMRLEPLGRLAAIAGRPAATIDLT